MSNLAECVENLTFNTFTMLLFERHELHLSTFPEGNFSHLIIPVEKTKALVEDAISKKEFVGIYEEDHESPEESNEEFKEFIRIMKDHCGISLPMDLFVEKEIDENWKILYWPNPGGLIELSKEDKLIVVDYNYSFKNNKINFDEYIIARDSMKFHLFESI